MAAVMEVANELVAITAETLPKVDYQRLWRDIYSCELLYFSIAFVILKFTLGELSDSGKKILRVLFKWYNLFMSVFSLVSFLCMGYAIYTVGLYSNECDRAFDNALFRITAKVFYYSKFLEYIDSFYLPLMAKPLSFLQFFHHLGAPMDMWLFVQYSGECIWIFVFLNGFIHFVMYGYYWTRLMKFNFPMPKQLITAMQITQFNVGFYLVWWYKDIPCYRKDPMRMLAWIFNYWYVGTVLLLFINFFIKSYVFPKPHTKPKTADKKVQ